MKKNHWLFVILGVVVLGLALLFAAAFGAGITYFFVQTEPAQAAFTAPFKVENDEGMLISDVRPESSAAEAGLVRGDIVLEINGEPVNHVIEMKDILAELEPGELAQLTVLHGDETRTLEVELEDVKGFATLGVGTCDFLKDSKAFLGGPKGDGRFTIGAEIVEVVPESPAATAGLQVGDVIISVNQKSISPKADLADLIQAYNPGDEVTLEVQSEGEEEPSEVVVILGAKSDNPEQAYLGVAYHLSTPMPGFEGGGIPFMEGLPFGELPESFEGIEGMPHFFFHHDGEFDGELPEGWEEDEDGYFHGMPFSGEGGMPHFFDIPELPEGIDSAVIISEVMEDTPAAEAGLQASDLIIAVDNKPVEEIESFIDEMQSRQPGDEITLTIVRSGDEIEVQVTLSEHPDNPEKGFLGVLAGTYLIHEEMVHPEGFDQDFEFKLPGVPDDDA